MRYNISRSHKCDLPLELSRLEHLTVNQGVACSSQARGAKAEQCSLRTLLFLFVLQPAADAAWIFPSVPPSPVFVHSPEKSSIYAEKSIQLNDFLKIDHLKKMLHCGILFMFFGN